MKRHIKNLLIPIGFTVFYLILSVVMEGLLGQHGAIVMTMGIDAAMAVVGYVYYRFRIRGAVRDEYDSKNIVRLAGLAFALGLLPQFLGTWIITKWPETYAAMSAAIDVSPAQYVILAIFFAPVCEEVLFRGIWYGQMRRSFGIIPSMLVSAAMFALIHGTVPQIYIALLSGMFFALAYERTGRLRVSIGLHVLHNMLSVMAGLISWPTFMFSPVVFVPTNVLCFALVGLMAYKAVKNDNRPQLLKADTTAIREVDTRQDEYFPEPGESVARLSIEDYVSEDDSTNSGENQEA